MKIGAIIGIIMAVVIFLILIPIVGSMVNDQTEPTITTTTESEPYITVYFVDIDETSAMDGYELPLHIEYVDLNLITVSDLNTYLIDLVAPFLASASVYAYSRSTGSFEYESNLSYNLYDGMVVFVIISAI